MADEVVTVEQLRQSYGVALVACLRGTDPAKVQAWVALAAEIRAALGGAGVVAPVYVPATTEDVSPWRSATDDPPPVGVCVLCQGRDMFGCAVYAGDGQWRDGAGPVTWPIRWVPL